ncbi:MAG: hypothetical protein ACK5EU_19555 [Pseudanabaena sp.]|jgi:hypothetical protein|uniref:hypothetical protein n=1 Tax=Pseudanabaena mucicola TaxID=71190 RepID=UPI0025753781|nr:hypothetical protein [Pseudanabaena mucicola]MCA6572492.1 hypothetical protein [Pseudanabaena sp. M53BS1SP1A06MG]MCA6580768.1 hypothetical protein [Pseudanabaena sp. M34BS1SP1A06MG]MCA6586366.1 hypothetical protein [Pseudanabaena sp. M051S1SP1A06QC]MCA6587773.1 hypothetical protein [Pseudanabaena sp. M109S1SP1A06QC]MCA6591597.1 hypothetical protein [Pseudanabaena sp. M38BS1SP1A06MG]MCA6595753.1 hypothetical protein [Pseudanabaena sp. M046S1SP1A06QC]MCA6599872.1 hypothetical protein [Pseud
MITPLKRKNFDELIPAVPTYEQYQYYSGNGQNVFRRVAISIASVIIFTILYNRVHENNPSSFAALAMFVCAALGGLYWMLEPVVLASIRNAKLRRFAYCGFWQAEVLDVYVSQEVLAREEKVDSRGRMDVSYDAESFLNIELGDETDFVTTLRLPMRRELKRVRPEQTVYMLLFSNDRRFGRVSRQTSDAYIPQYNLWIGDYPYLRRDAFIDLTKYMVKRSQKVAR